MRVAVYLRPLSSMERDGQGMGEQRKRLSSLAQERGWTQVSWFEDGAEPAEGLRDLLETVNQGRVEVVLVDSLGRLWGDMEGFLRILEEYLEPRGVHLISRAEGLDTTTTAGRALLELIRGKSGRGRLI